MHSRRYSLRRAWRKRRWVILATSTAIAAAVALAALLASTSLDIADRWASVLALFVSYVAAVTPGVLWLGRRSATANRANAGERLVRAVRSQWLNYVRDHDLERPKPIRLRWSATKRPLAAAGVRAESLDGSLLTDLNDKRPTASELAARISADPGLSVAIIGQPGAGKTTLAALLVIALADRHIAPSHRIPVLLPLAAWHPDDPLDDWIASQLIDGGAYFAANLDKSEAASMVEQNELILILDGLDEIPEHMRTEALTELDRAASVGRQLIITSRLAEFERLVATAGPMSRAVVLEVEPIRAPDVCHFLMQSEPVNSVRWDGLCRILTDEPVGAVAEAMSTPLMISLARRVYGDTRTDPARLSEMTSARELQNHLVERFLSTSSEGEDDSKHWQRYLAFYALATSSHARDPNLLWWRLARAVPKRTLVALVAAVVTMIGLATGLALTPVVSSMPGFDIIIPCGLIALTLGILCGRQAARSAHQVHEVPVRRQLAHLVEDLVVTIAIFCLIPGTIGVIVLVPAMSASKPAALEIAYSIHQQWHDDFGKRNLEFLALVLLAFASTIIVVSIVLNVGRGSSPRVTGPRLRYLPPSILIGILVGSPFGLIASYVARRETDDTRAIVATGALATIAAAIPVIVGRWLSVQDDAQVANTPLGVLRSDRTALFLSAAGVGAGTAVCSLGAMWALNLVDESARTITMPAALALVTSTLTFFGSSSSWLNYTIARIWLTLFRRLPINPARLLENACERGIVRQVGAAHQIKHDLIRQYLIGKWCPPGSAVRGRILLARNAAPTRLPRLAISVAILGIAIIPVGLHEIEKDFAPALLLRMPIDWNHEWGIRSIAFDKGGRSLTIVAAGIDDGTGFSVVRWPLEQHASPSYLHRSEDVVGCNPLRRDGKVYVRVNGKAELLDVLSHKRYRSGPSSGSTEDLAVSFDGSTEVFAGSRGAQLVRDRDRFVTLPVPWEQDFPGAIAVSRNGEKVAIYSAGADSSHSGLFVWDSRTGSTRRIGPSDSSGIAGPQCNLQFDSRGEIIASSVESGLRIWRLSDGHLIRSIGSPGSWFNGFSLSPDGRYVAGADGDATRIWDVRTGRHVATVPYTDGYIEAASFSDDGNTIAVATISGVALWNVPQLIAGQR